MVTTESGPGGGRAEVTVTTKPENAADQVAILREREAALREILQVISTSRADPAPVFETILKNAARLASAPLANLCLLNEARSHWTLAAHHGAGLRHLTVGKTTRLLDSKLVPAQTMLKASVVHVENLIETDLYQQGDPGRVAMVHEEGMRTIVGVPLLLEGAAIGCITLFRREVRAFSPDDIDLVETFAAQAVIAIENVRQFREVHERLEREQASREILHVISESRDDEMPVFRAILDRAERLCNATASGLQLVSDDGATLRYILGSGKDKGSFIPGETTWDLSAPYGMCEAVREARVTHLENLKDTDLYRSGDEGRVMLVDGEGVLTQLHVPLLKDGVAFGNMSLSRREQKPFTADQITLVETFAAQAVIAIENVRQFREVQMRLERERASGEILRTISESRDDEMPVFDAIVQNAERLCAAQVTFLVLLSEDHKTWTLAARAGDAMHEIKVGQTWDVAKEYPPYQATQRMEVVQEEDLKETDFYKSGDPDAIQFADTEGIRSRAFVPLIADGVAIGILALCRSEVGLYDKGDLALVEAFAAQAVIAIRNSTQLRELQTRLERESASSEVLSVISQSRDDDQRVFDALLEKAVALSQSAHGSVWLTDEEGVWLETVARNETNAARTAGFDRRRLDATDSAVANCVRERSVWRMHDIQDQPGYNDDPNFPNREWMSLSGARSMLLVPLVSGDQGIGLLAMYRSEVRPYSEEHLTLIEGFAAQAVIAIENTRQFKALETLNAELASGWMNRSASLNAWGV
ncbi:MAG: GAF domain-containing protein [Arenibacterium sp.]